MRAELCRIFLRRRLRRICVRGICAQMCAGEFARNLCPDFGRRNVRGILCRFVRGSFARSVRRKMFGGHLRGVCGGKIFSSGMCAEIFLIDDVRGDVFGDGRGIRAQKGGPGGPGGPKMAKKGQKCPKWPKMAKNGQKGGGAQKGPKMAHFVPEWYTSGSGATAFDSTGWQKSPEYALIRIAAGPLFPPGDKSRRFAKVAKVADFGPPRKSPISPRVAKVADFSPVGIWGGRVSRVLSSRNFLRGSLPPRKVCTADS